MAAPPTVSAASRALPGALPSAVPRIDHIGTTSWQDSPPTSTRDGLDDRALQRAILMSLEDAEEQQNKEREQARLAVEAVAAAEKLAEQEQQRQRQQRQLRPLPPPPGLQETFAPYRWLTDASIAFAYSQLSAPSSAACNTEASRLRDLLLGKSAIGCSEASRLRELVLLMDPATAFWLTLQKDPKDTDEATRELKLRERRLVLCPVNDSRDGAHADTGTHWGLLVWERQSGEDALGRFTYYDSGFYRGDCHQQASALASRLAGREAHVTAGACAKQMNSFDCGMYVLVFSEIIVAAFLEECGYGVHAGRGFLSPPIWEQQLNLVTPKEVADRRASYLRALRSASAAAAAAAGA